MWILIAFLTVNIAILAISNDTAFSSNYLGLSGGTANDTFGQAFLNTATTTTCSTVSPDFFSFAFCSFVQLYTIATSIIEVLGGFLFAWVSLFNIFNLIPGGSLFATIFIPFLGATELIAILFIVMKLAAVARGVIGI